MVGNVGGAGELSCALTDLLKLLAATAAKFPIAGALASGTGDGSRAVNVVTGVALVGLFGVLDSAIGVLPIQIIAVNLGYFRNLLLDH